MSKCFAKINFVYKNLVGQFEREAVSGRNRGIMLFLETVFKNEYVVDRIMSLENKASYDDIINYYHVSFNTGHDD